MPAEAGVQVLLATFNGERFLREQIDSIVRQTYSSVQILACDDGSSDTTAAILAEYAARFPEKVQMLSGAPTGSAKANFQRLMRASTAPYVAFSDQDDVWVPEKIGTEMREMQALEQRHGASTPLLVFSDLEVVNSELQALAPSLWQLHRIHPENIHNFPRLLMQNVVTGCTALMNRPLVASAQELPADASMHDWWVALVACAFGKARFVPDRLVRYRQHSANVLGAQAPVRLNKVPRWRDHSERAAQWDQIVRQARAFEQTYRSGFSRFSPGLSPGGPLATLKKLESIDASRSSTERVWRMFRSGFLLSPLRASLAVAWYLWDR